MASTFKIIQAGKQAKKTTIYYSIIGDVIGGEIKTLEGVMTISENDYIIKGVQGEFYPCKPDIFEATYEGYHE